MPETFSDTRLNWSCVTRCGCWTTLSTLFTVYSSKLAFPSGWFVEKSQWQIITIGPLHCKKSWRKTPPAWPDDAVLKYQWDGTLFWHADRVNPTSSDDEDGIFRSAMELSYSFCSHAKEFSDNFPSAFRRMNQNPKQHHRRFEPMFLWVQIHYSTTAPHLLTIFIKFTFLSTVFSFVS